MTDMKLDLNDTPASEFGGLPRLEDRSKQAGGELPAFLRAWKRNPLQTGAIAPSSRALCRAMAFAAAARPGSKIVELGPGTGVVTAALKETGMAERDLTLVELNPQFADILADRFPAARIMNADAFAAVRELAAMGVQADAIVSSLPLLIWPQEQRMKLLRDAAGVIGPHGRFVQFTYGLFPPIRPGAIPAHPSRRIWANVPPAVVWTYQPGKCPSS